MDSQDAGRTALRTLPTGDEAKERILWRRFLEPRSSEEFHETWLALQCLRVEGVQAGLLLTRSALAGNLVPAASWPGSRRPGAHVRAAAERVLTEKRALALELDPQGEGGEAGGTRTVIARPVEVAGEIIAIVVLDVLPRPQPELEAALRQLAWGSAWLSLRVAEGSGSSNEGLSALLEIVSTPLDHDRFHSAATAFVTELAGRFRCERVSLGFFARGRVRLRALSHSAQFDKRANLTRLIEAAMEESGDRKETVVWPPRDGSGAGRTSAHEALARESESATICTFPIDRDESVCGAVTLERASGERFSESELELIDAAVSMAGPILELHRRDGRSLPAVAIDSARTTLEHLLGPRHVALKLGATFAVLLVAFMALAKGDFRVAADTTLEPRVLRAAVAPFDGYLIEAPARAGDLVEEGDLLALLDDRDLALERARLSSQLVQLEKQHRQALADRDAPEARIAAARIDQVRAQHDLATDQLSRTRIEAPFRGIVVKGDLTQRVGSPLERGELLFEVAPLGDYRPALEVDERDIDELAVGQVGRIIFNAFPDWTLPLRIESITPVATASEGRNRFRVEASLSEAPERLRPGMKGVAKVEVGRRRLLWIWTHEMVDWLRLTLWNWLP